MPAHHFCLSFARYNTKIALDNISVFLMCCIMAVCIILGCLAVCSIKTLHKSQSKSKFAQAQARARRVHQDTQEMPVRASLCQLQERVHRKKVTVSYHRFFRSSCGRTTTRISCNSTRLWDIAQATASSLLLSCLLVSVKLSSSDFVL